MGGTLNTVESLHSFGAVRCGVPLRSESDFRLSGGQSDNALNEAPRSRRSWRPAIGQERPFTVGCFGESKLPASCQAQGPLQASRLQVEYRNLYDLCMKTTLNLNDQLFADAKALAAQQRTSLTRLIEEGLQLRLRATSNPALLGRVRLPVFKGRGGLVKGVNALSNKALLLALDDDA
jgi:hypothetical protein